MRRAFVILAVCLVVAACAGTKNPAVSSYELAGVTLKAGYDTVKPSCDAGALPAERCAQAKTIYNQARSAYLLAGDFLAVAVVTDDIVKRQAALQEYQLLSNNFTRDTTELLKLLVQWGLIKPAKEVPK